MKDELKELRGEFIRNLQKISCTKDDPWMRYGIAMCATILKHLRTEVKDIVDKAMKDQRTPSTDVGESWDGNTLPPDPRVSLVADSGLTKPTIDWLIAHGAASFEDITQYSYLIENDERKNYICINGKWIRYPFAIFRLSQEMNKVGLFLLYVDKTHIWDKCPEDVAERERLCQSSTPNNPHLRTFLTEEYDRLTSLAKRLHPIADIPDFPTRDMQTLRNRGISFLEELWGYRVVNEGGDADPIVYLGTEKGAVLMPLGFDRDGFPTLAKAMKDAHLPFR